MNDIRIPVIAPIRFYPYNVSFETIDNDQNPDNRVSTGYDYEGIKPFPFHLAVPRQWADGQPGIDTMIVVRSGSSVVPSAKLYDEDDTYVKDCHVDEWATVDGDTHYRVWLDGRSTDSIEGLHTIKLFDDEETEVLMESEPMLIGGWFTAYAPFEYTNFENDFGVVFDNGTQQWTGRIMLPVRLSDPEPEFEKETYKDDPGTLTTLRVIPQRAFTFDSLPVTSHLCETFQLACSCSNLYLDRINVNFEEIPEAEKVEGTNIKLLSGRAIFVDFNDRYLRERVETAKTDQAIEWATCDYDSYTITGNSIEVVEASVSSIHFAVADSASYDAGAKILVVLTLSDDSGTSDLPVFYFNGVSVSGLVWGTNYLFFQFSDAFTNAPQLYHESGEATYTAGITVYVIDN